MIILSLRAAFRRSSSDDPMIRGRRGLGLSGPPRHGDSDSVTPRRRDGAAAAHRDRHGRGSD
eukprot:745922-Hanusia_phi.AAC.3